jgi:ceramide glucosyltransferase
MLQSACELLSHIGVATAGLGCLYLLVASVAVLRFSHRRQSAFMRRPEPVTILKPLRNAEPDLLARLASFCRQDFGAPVQIICGIRNQGDPAVAVVQELAKSWPGVELNIDASNYGTNPKVSNLCSMFRLAAHDVLVIADSDIEVGPNYLASVVSELQAPGTGAVTCLYHGTSDGSFWSRQGALGINAHFLPNVVLALTFDLIRPCFGSTIALRRDTLERIGGIGSFADCLADDFAIGQAVRDAGYKVAIPSFSVGHACCDRSLSTLLARELRAARTIRSIEPLGYIGALIGHPFPLAVVAGLLAGVDAWPLALVALGCRGVLCLCVETAFEMARPSYILIPLRDLLSFAIHLAGLFGKTVSWHGSTYSITCDGRMIAQRDQPQP